MTTQPEALRLVDVPFALRDGLWHTQADHVLLNQHVDNETLRKSVALLQQHHATAWNRGHTMGMKANEDTARRALDAVQRDAWGNTQLTEALLKAEAQRDALLEALRTLLSYAFTLEMRLLDADGEHRAMQKARAAIKAAEEGK